MHRDQAHRLNVITGHCWSDTTDLALRLGKNSSGTGYHTCIAQPHGLESYELQRGGERSIRPTSSWRNSRDVSDLVGEEQRGRTGISGLGVPDANSGDCIVLYGN